MPSSAFGNAIDPLVSLFVYTGDVGLDDGTGASVYVLDKSKATQLTQGRRPAVPDGPAPRRHASPCPTASAA